jgi:hypothetical protein
MRCRRTIPEHHHHWWRGLPARAGPIAFRVAASQRAGCPLHHGKRLEREEECPLALCHACGASQIVQLGERKSRAPLSTRTRATAGVQYTALCRRRSSFVGHNAVKGSPGDGLPEKRVTATTKAVETPRGGPDRPSTTRPPPPQGGEPERRRDERRTRRQAGAPKGHPQCRRGLRVPQNP